MPSIHARTLAGEAVVVTVAEGLVQSVTPLAGPVPEKLPVVAPGLVDLQVNGYGGVDFNALPFDAGEVGRSLGELCRGGVTGMLPTIVTNSAEKIGQLLAGFRALVEDDAELAELVPGFHLEGPFISKLDGARGAHPAEHVVPPDLDLVKQWQDAAGGGIRLITMSPEWPGSTGFVAGCVEMGIRVAIGHTAASPEQITEAVASGATLSTHLGNACELQLHRHHNVIWQQLAEGQMWASVIADGFHLPDAVLKTILAVKRSRSILVSDVTCFGGMEPGSYRTHIGGEVVLGADGKLVIAGNEEFLAGSALPLLAGIEHLVGSGLVGLDRAWESASRAPAAYLGLPDRGELVAGRRADMVLFTRDGGGTRIERVLVRGRETTESC